MVAKTSDGVAAGRIAKRSKRSKLEAVEYGAEIDKERIIARTGEYLDPAGQVVDCP